MIAAGTVLDGRYEILGLIATGGMGAIYRARRVLLGDEVAIKVVRADVGDRTELHERFMRESRAAAQLKHPNIVSILDFNVSADGHPFLVMEYLTGPSLKEEIARAAPFAPDRVGEILVPICDAVGMAHDRGILHRDIKPANIVSHRFASGDVAYKLIDFGLVNISAMTDETRLTVAHEFLGTVSYASPEQLSGEELDARSDVYSLGVVAFEMLTGRLPFTGAGALSIVAGHLKGDAPAPSSLRPDLPASVDDVIGKALARDRGNRWSTMGEFGRALAGADRTVVATARRTEFSGLRTKYDIGEPIGHGRLGSEVYAGMHRAMEYPVAIRILRRGERKDWEARKARFLREARALQIAHPFILQVRDYGEEGDLVYVVTDLVEGTSLRELLDRDGALPWTRLARFVRQLCDGAIALHRRSGLLCGLNPDIIRLGIDEEGERLIVSSAGICQIQDLLATLDESTLRGGDLVDLELSYVAPELLMGGRPDVRSDIYTIGVLAYEMATGKRPFVARTMPELLGAILQGRVADPHALEPSLPETFTSGVLRCLAPEPAGRFASVAGLKAILGPE